MHHQVEEDGGESRNQPDEETTAVQIPRYFIFVGCPGCDNCEDHPPMLGWDSLASASDSLEEAREACLQVPEHLWWQLVDVVIGKVILRSSHLLCKPTQH